MTDQESADYTFDEAPTTKSVSIRNKDGVVHPYALKGMGGPEMATWMEIFANRVKAEREGRHNFEGFQAELISLCLFDSDGNRVPKEKVKAWSAATQNALFDICQDMNNLSDDAKAKAKKGSAR